MFFQKMKAKIFIIFLLFCLTGCKKESQTIDRKWIKISHHIQYQESKDFFDLKSGKSQYHISKKKLPYKKVLLLNASLVGYFTELGAEDKIVGISSPEYIYSEKIQKKLAQKSIQNIGNEQKYDLEKMIALKPDAVFTNYIQTFENTYELLRKNGIDVIFIDEYLVEKPLEKAKIIEIFGKLLGQEKAAESVYITIQNHYRELVEVASKTTNKPKILVNEMYGSQWYLPGGKTFVADLIKSAGGDYVLKNNQDEKAVPKSFEEVLILSTDAKFWINLGNHQNKNELLNINPVYSKLKVFQKGKLFTIGARQKGSSNDFFESGVVHADWVLKDYIKIFHPELFPGYTPIYLKELR